MVVEITFSLALPFHMVRNYCCSGTWMNVDRRNRHFFDHIRRGLLKRLLPCLLDRFVGSLFHCLSLNIALGDIDSCMAQRRNLTVSSLL